MKNKPLGLFVLFIIIVIAFLSLSFRHLTANYFFSTQAQNRELIISFLDVGQGDAALIKTPSGHNILIDGGPGTKILKRLPNELSWYDKTIDLMILTHPHSDHVDGLIPVLKRYEAKQILSTGAVHSSPTYLAWLDLVREQNIPLVIIDREQTIDLGDDCYLHIIYPLTNLSGREVTNLNNSSIVARLVYKDTSFLFMGDAETEVEQELVSLVPPPLEGGGQGEVREVIVLRSGIMVQTHQAVKNFLIWSGRNTRLFHPV